MRSALKGSGESGGTVSQPNKILPFWHLVESGEVHHASVRDRLSLASCGFSNAVLSQINVVVLELLFLSK